MRRRVQLKCDEDARSNIDGANGPGAPEKPQHLSALHRIQPWHHWGFSGPALPFTGTDALSSTKCHSLYPHKSIPASVKPEVVPRMLPAGKPKLGRTERLCTSPGHPLPKTLENIAAGIIFFHPTLNSLLFFPPPFFPPPKAQIIFAPLASQGGGFAWKTHLVTAPGIRADTPLMAQGHDSPPGSGSVGSGGGQSPDHSPVTSSRSSLPDQTRIPRPCPAASEVPLPICSLMPSLKSVRGSEENKAMRNIILSETG